MEQEKKNGGLITLVIILCLLVLGMGGYIIYDKVLNDNENLEQTPKILNTQKEETKITKNINDIAGQYVVEYTNLKTEDGNNNKGTITLNLYDNGIFGYTYSQYAPYGTFGNYYIDGDTIVLTTWFNTTSGTDLIIAKGSKTLKINSDGTISDNNIKAKELIDNEITEATLTKNDTNLNSENMPSNSLGAAFFTASNHTISDSAM